LGTFGASGASGATGYPKHINKGVVRMGCVLLIFSMAIGLPRQRSGGTNERDLAP
jgi:hypothetical protein